MILDSWVVAEFVTKIYGGEQQDADAMCPLCGHSALEHTYIFDDRNNIVCGGHECDILYALRNNDFSFGINSSSI